MLSWKIWHYGNEGRVYSPEFSLAREVSELQSSEESFLSGKFASQYIVYRVHSHLVHYESDLISYFDLSYSIHTQQSGKSILLHV